LSWAAAVSLPVAGPSLQSRLDRLKLSPADASGVEAEPLVGAETPVVARLTYDKAKAAQGGVVFATPYAAPDEAAAMKGGRGLILTSGWGSTYVALAGRVGVPAFLLSGAKWTEAGLRVDAIRFGKATLGPRGVGVSRVESRATSTLREGAVVRLDGRRGRVSIVPRDRETVVLRAAEAITAYQRSRDVGALANWLRSQLEAGGLSDLERIALAESALAGVSGAPARSTVRKVLLETLGPGAPAVVAALEARLD